MRFTTPIKVALAASTILAPAGASYGYDLAEDEIEEFIVVAGRRSQPITEVAKSVSVITEEALAGRQYTFVVDALQSLPGVNINQNGTFGGAATVSIRGASTDQTVILIDGVQMNDTASPGGGFNFANLDPNGIARIEVLRGPQAVLYGSDAIGGVINIITKSGGEGFGADAFAEYGAFDSLRLGGNARGGSDRIGFNLSASYAETDGISAADEANGNTEADGYENLTLRGKVTAKLTDTASFEVTSSYVDSENEFDSFGPADGDEVGETTEFSIAGRARLDLFDGKLNNTFSVEYSNIERENFRAGVSTFTAEGERFNLDYLGVLDITEGWTLTAGAQHERIDSKTDDADALTIDSLFGIVTYSGIEGLTLSGGLRVDDHETFGSTTNGELNAAYVVESTGTKLTAAWSEGFKAPTIFQLTFSCCGFDANPDLNPERAKAWEVGVSQPLLDGRLILGATYFDQDVEDLIEFTFSAGYQNIAQASIKGIELTIDAALTDTLSLQANYTHQDADDEGTDERLVRRPDDEAFAALTWQPTGKLSTTIGLTYNGDELDTSGETVPSWTRVDLRASYALTDTVELYGRIDNLFDEDYQQIFGYGTPGTSAFAGIRARF